jgi:hypothetical protein
VCTPIRPQMVRTYAESIWLTFSFYANLTHQDPEYAEKCHLNPQVCCFNWRQGDRHWVCTLPSSWICQISSERTRIDCKWFLGFPKWVIRLLTMFPVLVQWFQPRVGGWVALSNRIRRCTGITLFESNTGTRVKTTCSGESQQQFYNGGELYELTWVCRVLTMWYSKRRPYEEWSIRP